jgi:hypothetical protein
MILDFEARFSDQMEEIYAAIVQSTNNRQVNELLRRKTQIRRNFAKRLVTFGYPQLVGSRTKSVASKTTEAAGLPRVVCGWHAFQKGTAYC